MLYFKRNLIVINYKQIKVVLLLPGIKWGSCKYIGIYCLIYSGFYVILYSTYH